RENFPTEESLEALQEKLADRLEVSTVGKGLLGEITTAISDLTAYGLRETSGMASKPDIYEDIRSSIFLNVIDEIVDIGMEVHPSSTTYREKQLEALNIIADYVH